MKFLLPILILCTACLGFGAAKEVSKKSLKIEDRIRYIRSYDSDLLKNLLFEEEGDSFKNYAVIISQEIGHIYFKSASLIETDESKPHLIADKIYHLCKDKDEKKISKAETLLTNEQDLRNSPAHHCTALICLGQAYYKFPDRDGHHKAIGCFTEAFDKYKFSGAAHSLAVLRSFYDLSAAFYYMQLAIKVGFKINTPLEEMAKTLKLEEKEYQIIQAIIDSEK